MRQCSYMPFTIWWTGTISHKLVDRERMREVRHDQRCYRTAMSSASRAVLSCTLITCESVNRRGFSRSKSKRRTVNFQCGFIFQYVKLTKLLLSGYFGVCSGLYTSETQRVVVGLNILCMKQQNNDAPPKLSSAEQIRAAIKKINVE